MKQLRDDLHANSDEKVKAGASRFFKENISVYGVKTATVSSISKSFIKQIKPFGKEFTFSLCEQLWASGNMEESFVACSWTYAFGTQFEPTDFEVFERWVSTYVSNWASCDTLCNHTIGLFITRYPEFLVRLHTWTQSQNRWMRRAAAVALIVPARKGLFHKDVFAIADSLLTDEDDLVQKGYGWMLKSASQADSDAVFRFVMERKRVMPRTALRYAIEKMPTHKRQAAMAK